jgi:flagellar biosynthesis chaperone FliJ
MQTLSQRDPKWGEVTIGHSTSKIKDYGCTLVCLAILAGTTPDVVNAFLTAVGGFSVDRIIWKKLNETKLGLTFPDMGRQYVYNDVAVREAIEKNGGCLVEVDYDGVVATPSDRHWVLYIGNHQLIDPWTGTIKPTSSYPLVKGYAIIEKNNEQNDLTSSEENILQFLREQNADEGKVREAFGSLTDKIALQGQVQTLTDKITGLEASQIDLQKQIDNLSSKLIEEQKSEADWQRELMTAKGQLENELEQNALIDEERKRFKRLYEEALVKFPTQYTWKDIYLLIIKKLKSYDRKS